MDDEMVVESKNEEKKYTISLGVKLPIPGVNYSSVQSMISVSGDNYEELKIEAFTRLEQQTLELIESIEGVFS